MKRLHLRPARRSLGLKLVALFLVLAFALGATFLAGMRQAISGSWRELGRPLVRDYAERLVADLGTPPDTARAQAVAERLRLRIRIDGPQVHWSSDAGSAVVASPLPEGPRWLRADAPDDDEAQTATTSAATTPAPSHALPHGGLHERPRHGRWLYTVHTADGHEVRLGLQQRPWRDEPRLAGWLTLVALLCLIGVAYGLVHRWLRPLNDIHAGAQRFGTGDFSRAIPVRRNDELGRVAAQVNAMAQSVQQMLDAKRGLLLALSHELRSPLTRARLNAELAAPEPGAPADADATRAHAALLSDLAAMRDLVSDLLESERLASGHAALQPEAVDLAALLQDLVADAPGGAVQLSLPRHLPLAWLDRVRLRLALRNLLDNAWRHSAGAALPPTVQVSLVSAEGEVMGEVMVEGTGEGTGEGAAAGAVPGAAASLRFVVRDHGPGVPPAQLAHLAEPFYRADAARQRATGGVGLGLYLCRLVAQAHGGALRLRNAEPGFEAELRLPFTPPPGSSTTSQG